MPNNSVEFSLDDMTRARVIRVASIVVLTAFVSFGHLVYSWWCSLRLYEWSGGIQKVPSGWIQFGGASYAWVIPLQLPGAVTLRLCQLQMHSDCNGVFLAQLSGILLLLASVITAYLISSVLLAMATRHQICWGRFYWRAIIIVLGLAWVPIREDFAPVWQYTVKF